MVDEGKKGYRDGERKAWGGIEGGMDGGVGGGWAGDG